MKRSQGVSVSSVLEFQHQEGCLFSFVKRLSKVLKMFCRDRLQCLAIGLICTLGLIQCPKIVLSQVGAGYCSPHSANLSSKSPSSCMQLSFCNSDFTQWGIMAYCEPKRHLQDISTTICRHVTLPFKLDVSQHAKCVHNLACTPEGCLAMHLLCGATSYAVYYNCQVSDSD